ncbi:MAG: rod shape-determining protein RodA [Candidatus Omnitrophica bacterium]|nr:rod shape-determining protein RodA [Candidatus Omnitrophota bacterium]
MRVALRSSRAWDWAVLAAAASLALLGGLAMCSASAAVNPRLAVRHATWIALGMAVSFAVARLSPRRWMDAAGAAYGLTVSALALVLAAGAVRLGASRWLSVFGLSLQPSEFMKLATITLLARYLAGQPRPLPLRAVGGSLLIAGVPALLIFLQPDLGSASIFGAVWIGMVWMAGASPRLLAGIAASLLAILPIGWHLLHDYQRDRLLVFINPHADPLGAGYAIIQSTIAIGSGQWWGRGWFAGTQNQLSFLPERHSDFIFSVIGEEWGFAGSAAVIALFGILLVRMLRVARELTDSQGRLFLAGACAWLGYQVFVNIGMVMGLVPVVGVPLPLISYGGSSMLTIWAALGLLQGLRWWEVHE